MFHSILHVQWTTNPVSTVAPLDPSEWINLPKLPLPIGGETIDSSPGWVRCVLCQGLDPSGDHVAVEPLPGDSHGCKITTWNDDPDDWLVDEFHASVWTIPSLFNDPAVDRRWNTRQHLTVFAAGVRLAENIKKARSGWTAGIGIDVVVLPWSDFVPPAESITRHGIWMPDALFEKSARLVPRALRDWRSSIEGVPSSDVTV